MVHPYSSIDMTAAWIKLCFILSVRSDFHMTDSLLIASYFTLLEIEDGNKNNIYIYNANGRKPNHGKSPIIYLFQERILFLPL